MTYFAGPDVSVKETSVRIVDDAGKIVREARVASEAEALLQALTNTIYCFKRVGLEGRTHGGNYRFLSIRCDRNCDHFHRLPLSVGTFNGSGGLWRTGSRRTAFASISIR